MASLLPCPLASDAPWLRSWTALPGPSLQPHVRAYVEQAIDVPPGVAVSLTQSASVEPVAGVAWPGPVWLGQGRGLPAPPVALVGPIGAPLTSRFERSVRGFFVRFAPTGARVLLGVRGADYVSASVFDRAVPEALLPGSRIWRRAVLAAPDFETRVALTEAWLEGWLARSAADACDDGAAFAASAVALIEGSDGVLRMDTLAAALGVSASTLRRRFAAELGLAPKRFSEVVRFREAHAFLHSHPEAMWADAVVQFGYSDQAHLVHAYTRYAGVSPSRWTAVDRAMDLAFGMGARPSEAV